MTLDEFLLARIAEKERIGQLVQRSSLGADGRRSIVLAECEAMRRIVARYAAAEVGPEGDYGWGAADALRAVLGELALPYADHPDYRNDW